MKLIYLVISRARNNLLQLILLVVDKTLFFDGVDFGNLLLKIHFMGVQIQSQIGLFIFGTIEGGSLVAKVQIRKSFVMWINCLWLLSVHFHAVDVFVTV
jgi:hypothetical protein